jgi:hypothetical protein
MKAQTMYDAAAKQVVTVTVKPGKKIHHVLLLTDEIYQEYLAGKPTEPEASLEFLYELTAQDLTGITGVLPENWKSLVPKADKHDVIANGLLKADFIELEEAIEDESEFTLEDYSQSVKTEATYKLRCAFDGEMIDCEHTLRSFTPEEREHLGKIAQSKVFTEAESQKKIAAFYDKVLVENKNYHRGVVPQFHKVAVIVRHFSSESRVLQKN